MRAPLIDDAAGGRAGSASTVNGEPAAELNRGRGGKTPTILLRWTLFAALFAGLLGMHVLTVGHRDEGHGTLPVPIGEHEQMDAVILDPAAPAAGPAGLPDIGGPEGMAGCILFLAAGVGVAVLALLRRRFTDPHPSAPPPPRVGAVTGVLRRGPPRRTPRVALCVIRV